MHALLHEKMFMRQKGACRNVHVLMLFQGHFLPLSNTCEKDSVVIWYHSLHGHYAGRDCKGSRR